MSQDVYPELIGLTYDIKRNPRYSTIIHNTIGGQEARATFMAYPYWDFTLNYELIRQRSGKTELTTLMGFFMYHSGSWDTWLFSCPEDKTVTDMQFGTGNGTTTQFQITRTFGSFVEPINNLNGSPVIKVNGVTKNSPADYSISSTGMVTFTSPPTNTHPITWSGSFYYRCRFSDDVTDFNQFMQNRYEVEISFVGSPTNKLGT